MGEHNKVTSNLQEKQKKKKRSRGDKSREDEVDGEASNDTRKQFVSADYGLMCDWLEVPENLDAITGSKGKTKIGARFKTKKQAFEALATYINERQLKGSKLATIDGDGARNRFTLLDKKYKVTKPIVESTGWGLTAEDEANHVDTIEAKLESLCPCYYRLDAIFGSDPNINFSENNYNSSVPGVEVDHMPWTDTFTHDVVEGFESFENLNPEEVGVDASLEQTHSHSVNEHGTPDRSEVPIPPIEIRIPTEEGAFMDASPIGADNPVEEGVGRSTESGVQERGGSASSSQKKQKSQKKQSFDKGGSVSTAFAAGLEVISQTKAQANILKERGQDLVFKALECDRSLRAESSEKQLEFQVQSAQKQLDFQIQNADRQFQMEIEKLKVVEKRIATDQMKIAADAKRDLMQAQVSIVNSNPNLSAAEIANLFRMLSNLEHITGSG